MRFEVRAITPDQAIKRLEIEAATEAEARRQLASQSLRIASIQEMNGLSFKWKIWNTADSAKPRQALLHFSQELLALLNAGLAIVEALEALLEKEGNQERHSHLSQLVLLLREGKRFSTALAELPQLYPPLFIGMMKAAEGTNDLPRALGRYISYQKKVDLVRTKVTSAAIYPSILLFVGGLVAFFLLGYVVPQFAGVYQGSGRSLPYFSQLLLDWGKLVSNHPKEVALTFATLIIAGVIGIYMLAAHSLIKKALIRMPAIGDRIQTYRLSHLYLTLGMLLEGGVPIVSALETAMVIAPQEEKRQLVDVIHALQSGVPLSTALERQGLTTSISLRMLRVGERSGDLGAMLSRSAAFYDEQNTQWIDRFTRSFEPILMTIIGLVVGVIVVLLYLPIFDLAGSLS